ncbi:MAG: hypothetical protein F4Z31_01815 [Gemmatimonadetes bacterium]|nr:hypothetical protein [Gemmatimonadota bacterium]
MYSFLTSTAVRRCVTILVAAAVVLQTVFIVVSSDPALADKRTTSVASPETYYVDESYQTQEQYTVRESYSIPLTKVTKTVDVFNYRTESYYTPKTRVEKKTCVKYSWSRIGTKYCSQYRTTVSWVCQARGGCGPFTRKVRVAPYTTTSTTYVCQASGGCGPFYRDVTKTRTVTKTRRVAKTRTVYSYVDVPHSHTTTQPTTTTLKNQQDAVRCKGNREPDKNGGCKLKFSRTAPCPDGLERDPVSRLCINTLSRDDPDVDRPLDYCESAYEWEVDGKCVVKQRADDPERSKHCPAGQVFYSTIGCDWPGGVPPIPTTTPTPISCQAGEHDHGSGCHRHDPPTPACTASGGTQDYEAIDGNGHTTLSVVVPKCGTTPAVTVTAGPDRTEGQSATFNVSASPAPASPLRVQARITDSGDFARSGHAGIRTITVPTSGSIAVSIRTDDDSTDEPDGTLTATIRSGTGYTLGAPSTATLTIRDNDAPATQPTVSISAVRSTVYESEPAEFTLTARPAPTAALTVDVVVNDISRHGFAVSGQTGRRRVSFNAGSPTATLHVRLDDDSHDEPNGFIHGAVVRGSGYNHHGSAIVTVRDNDPLPQVAVAFGQASYNVDESDDTSTPADREDQATVTVTLSAAPQGTVTIPIVATNQGGATSSDYSGVPASVTFDSGQTSRTFTVTATDDTDDDDGESVKLGFGTLPAAVNAGTINEATVTITDNDLTLAQQCEALHGPGWTPVLYPDGTPWTDSGGQILCAMPH